MIARPTIGPTSRETSSWPIISGARLLKISRASATTFRPNGIPITQPFPTGAAIKSGTMADYITLECMDYCRSMINQYTYDPNSSTGNLLYSFTGVAGEASTINNGYHLGPNERMAQSGHPTSDRSLWCELAVRGRLLHRRSSSEQRPPCRPDGCLCDPGRLPEPQGGGAGIYRDPAPGARLPGAGGGCCPGSGSLLLGQFDQFRAVL